MNWKASKIETEPREDVSRRLTWCNSDAKLLSTSLQRRKCRKTAKKSHLCTHGYQNLTKMTLCTKSDVAFGGFGGYGGLGPAVRPRFTRAHKHAFHMKHALFLGTVITVACQKLGKTRILIISTSFGNHAYDLIQLLYWRTVMVKQIKELPKDPEKVCRVGSFQICMTM